MLGRGTDPLETSLVEPGPLLVSLNPFEGEEEPVIRPTSVGAATVVSQTVHVESNVIKPLKVTGGKDPKQPAGGKDPKSAGSKDPKSAGGKDPKSAGGKDPKQPAGGKPPQSYRLEERHPESRQHLRKEERHLVWDP